MTQNARHACSGAPSRWRPLRSVLPSPSARRRDRDDARPETCGCRPHRCSASAQSRESSPTRARTAPRRRAHRATTVVPPAPPAVSFAPRCLLLTIVLRGFASRGRTTLSCRRQRGQLRPASSRASDQKIRRPGRRRRGSERCAPRRRRRPGPTHIYRTSAGRRRRSGSRGGRSRPAAACEAGTSHRGRTGPPPALGGRTPSTPHPYTTHRGMFCRRTASRAPCRPGAPRPGAPAPRGTGRIFWAGASPPPSTIYQLQDHTAPRSHAPATRLARRL